MKSNGRLLLLSSANSLQSADKTEPDCSQRHTVVGWKATVICYSRENSSEISGKKCHKGIKTLKAVAQRCCGVSTIGVIQSLTCHSPEHLDVCWPCLGWESGWGVLQRFLPTCIILWKISSPHSWAWVCFWLSLNQTSVSTCFICCSLWPD